MNVNPQGAGEEGSVGAGQAAEEAAATSALQEIFRRLKCPDTNMFQGHSEEEFLAIVRPLIEEHPTLSLAQIVASEFAIVPDLIPVTSLSSRVGKAVNFPRGKESRIETNRKTNRRYFIIRHNLKHNMCYVYEITDEKDPTRGWHSLDPHSRLGSCYPILGSAQAQQSFLKKYHTSRFFGAEDTTAVLVGANSMHIDMTAFQDPTEGTDWSPVDFTPLAVRKRGTGGRGFSWLNQVGESVDEMFDTKRQTLKMMYANSRGHGNAQEIQQLRSDFGTVERCVLNHDRLFTSMIEHNQSMDRANNAILRELQGGLHRVQEDVAEVRDTQHNQQNHLQRHDNQFDDINTRVEVVERVLQDVLGSREAPRPPNVVVNEQALKRLPSPGVGGFVSKENSLLMGMKVIPCGDFDNIVQGGIDAVKSMITNFGGLPRKNLLTKESLNFRLVYDGNISSRVQAAIDLNVPHYTIEELLEELKVNDDNVDEVPKQDEEAADVADESEKDDDAKGPDAVIDDDDNDDDADEVPKQDEEAADVADESQQDDDAEDPDEVIGDDDDDDDEGYFLYRDPGYCYDCAEYKQRLYSMKGCPSCFPEG